MTIRVHRVQPIARRRMGANQADLGSGKTDSCTAFRGAAASFSLGVLLKRPANCIPQIFARVFKASCFQNKESAACSLHACADAGMLGVVRFSSAPGN